MAIQIDKPSLYMGKNGISVVGIAKINPDYKMEDVRDIYRVLYEDANVYNINSRGQVLEKGHPYDLVYRPQLTN